MYFSYRHICVDSNYYNRLVTKVTNYEGTLSLQCPVMENQIVYYKDLGGKQVDAQCTARTFADWVRNKNKRLNTSP